MDNLKKLDNYIADYLESLPPEEAVIIAKAYLNIPFGIKKGIVEFYAVLGKEKSIKNFQLLKKTLEDLKKACDANPSQKSVYEYAKKEAEKYMQGLTEEKGLSLFDEIEETSSTEKEKPLS